MSVDFLKYSNVLSNNDFIEYSGRVTKIIGLTIESDGPHAKVGELCKIHVPGKKEEIAVEVVGFRNNKVLLMPLGEMSGISPGSTVVSTGKVLQVGVGEKLIGRIIDGMGNPIDGKGDIEIEEYYPSINSPPDPLTRKRIEQHLTLGIKSIDGLLTIGKGQRVGIFSGSGVGKSTIIGMIARNTKADINVIALVGERGREVREFIEKDLKEEGLGRSVIIVATSEKPALIRIKAAFIATAVAEYFRDQGKDVLFLMDSLTRFAMAQREIGLAIGEPPVSRGYTPSVFSIMPRLLERAGNSEKGSITALYSVLVDADDMTEPVTDISRGILDGHIVLSRDLANRNIFPAVDILASISRLMVDIVTDEHKQIADRIKENLAIYRDAEDLINIGAYVRGSNEKIDYSIDVIDNITNFIKQKIDEKFSFEEIMSELKNVLV